MELTNALKGWLVANAGVKSDASDDDFRAAAAKAIVDGTLSAEKLTELCTSKEDEAVKGVMDLLGSLQKSIDELKSEKAAAGSDTKAAASATATAAEPADDAKNAGESKDTKTADAAADAKETKDAQPETLDQRIKRLMSGGSSDLSRPAEPVVKRAVESYSRTKTALVCPERTVKGSLHPMGGQQAQNMGRPMDTSSDADKALAGVWAKFQILAVTPKLAGNPRAAFEMLNEHEKDLLVTLVEDEMWDDSKDSRLGTRKGYQGGLKALIDTSASGGIEAAPIVFDDMVIEAPLLYGELYPLVNVVPLASGRRIEGVQTGRVTGSWGGVDDTAISLFTTTSYVTAFDTTIFRWEGAVTIGLDFLSDTPIDFGAHMTRQYGERLLEDLDDVIAAGNGSTQPEGISVKSGTTSVAFGGATSISNYESLRYGVAKAELAGPMGRTAVFVGNEVSYRRVRAIPVGASDARRLFGNDHLAPGAGGYGFAGASFRINESLANTTILFCVMGRYRMYRRKGFTVRTTMEGSTLVRANEVLITVQARYGGQLERGAVCAKTTTAPA